MVSDSGPNGALSARGSTEHCLQPLSDLRQGVGAPEEFALEYETRDAENAILVFGTLVDGGAARQAAALAT